MRSAWVSDDVMSHILAALTKENKLAIVVSLTTGLRISDVLNLKTSQLKNKFTVVEQKTKKKKLVRLSDGLLDELIAIAGSVFVFEHRLDPRRHRTRQAVYKDVRRAAKAFRIDVNVSVHSARKLYAVKQYKRTCSMERVQELLNHSSEAVTMVYALADQLTA